MSSRTAGSSRRAWRSVRIAAGLSLLALLAPMSACAQAAPDRTAFGSGVYVAAGQVVGDAVSFGGDTVVEGAVLGDAVAFGGSVILREGGAVTGEVMAVGGSVVDERAGDRAQGAEDFGAQIERARVAFDDASSAPRGAGESFWHWLGETARSAVAHVLLFLLGLLLIGAWRDRLGAMQATIIKDGLKTAGAGLLGYVVAVLAIVLLCVTIIGIPIAVVVGLALPVATYVGLAAAATVIGAALPLPQLAGKEIHQLAAGVGVLFLASVVPAVGGIATVLAACLGFGALLRTRFRDVPPSDLPEGGPYRTSAAG